MSKEEDKKNYLRGLWDDYVYSIQKFDEQTLLLSGGALGLSLTFIKDIVPLDGAIYMWSFYLAISFFVIVITLGFVAHLVSAKSIEKRIGKVENDDYSFTANNTISIINIFNAIVLVLAIGFLVFYCIANISNYRKTPTKDTKKIIEISKPFKNSTTLYITNY